MADRRKPLNDLQKLDYVDLIRKGKLRYEAANQLNVTVSMVQNAYRADPNFRAEVDDAVHEANEPIERGLYESALAQEPWAVKMFLQAREKERWGKEPTKVHIVHELDGSALLESVAGLAAELETRRMHANSIATGGQLIEYEPVLRHEHPVVYELGKGPTIHSHAKELLNKNRGMPRRPPTSDVQDVASPLLNDLPRRPGT